MKQERQTADAAPWRVQVLTLFPEMFPGPLGFSLAGKALQQNLWQIEAKNIRDFATDRHKTVDDTCFGGGPGMVLMPEIVDQALVDAKKKQDGPLIYLTPRGKPLVQDTVRALVRAPGMTLLCGRYEGVDERVLRHHEVQEISIGDYVLSGGELAALTLIDACVRLLPGVMGDAASGEDESFEAGLLEYPLYTKPQEWKGQKVPDVLLSGHHAEITAWRKAEAEKVTEERRPDLWDAYKRFNRARE